MKRFLIGLLFFTIPFISIAQISGENEVYLNGDFIDAKFEGGGIQKFHEYITKNIDYAVLSKSGRIVFSFTISETGEIKNIKIVEFPYIEMATEIIRVIKTTPNWEPAKRGGKPVSLEVKFPMKFSQRTKESNIEKNKPIFSNENKPEFEGGSKSFYDYITKNFRYPNVNLYGQILVEFIIDTNGELVDINVIKDLGYGTKQEIIRLLKASPRWSPGMKNGKPIRVKCKIPIKIDFRAD